MEKEIFDQQRKVLQRYLEGEPTGVDAAAYDMNNHGGGD